MDGNEHADDLANQGQESRAHSRYSVNEECTVLLVNHGMPMKARVVDVSLDGCQLRTSDRFPGKPGRAVEITFKVKGYGFRFSGIVRWTDGKNLIGVHFENMIARRKDELTEVIEELEAQAARAHTAHSAAAEPAKPSVAELLKPIEAVSAQPAVSKAAQPPVAGNAMTPAAQIQAIDARTPATPEPPVQRAAKARDRREQSRHEVDTSATIFLVRVGSALRGQIVDLSVGGCRIRTEERFPVGIYTRVETEFQAQGLPFRLGGVIQAIHDRFTVGIRFLDVSDRKRQQVLDLIDEMEQERAETPGDEG